MMDENAFCEENTKRDTSAVTEKRPYKTPTLTKLGGVEYLTQGRRGRIMDTATLGSL